MRLFSSSARAPLRDGAAAERSDCCCCFCSAGQPIAGGGSANAIPPAGNSGKLPRLSYAGGGESSGVMPTPTLPLLLLNPSAELEVAMSAEEGGVRMKDSSNEAEEEEIELSLLARREEGKKL